MPLDQLAGSGQGRPVRKQAGTVEENIGLKKRHRAALGDLPGRVQIRLGTGHVAIDVAQPGVCEEAARCMVLTASGAKCVHRVVYTHTRDRSGRFCLGTGREQRLEKLDAGECQSHESDAEQHSTDLDFVECLLRSLADLRHSREQRGGRGVAVGRRCAQSDFPRGALGWREKQFASSETGQCVEPGIILWLFGQYPVGLVKERLSVSIARTTAGLV